MMFVTVLEVTPKARSLISKAQSSTFLMSEITSIFANLEYKTYTCIFRRMKPQTWNSPFLSHSNLMDTLVIPSSLILDHDESMCTLIQL